MTIQAVTNLNFTALSLAYSLERHIDLQNLRKPCVSLSGFVDRVVATLPTLTLQGYAKTILQTSCDDFLW